MALTPERRAQMDAVLKGNQTTPVSSTLTPERRAQMDAVLAGNPQVTQAPTPQAPTQPGGFQGFVQGIAKPFEKFGASIAGIAEGGAKLLGGDVKGANEALSKERDFGYFGKARPIGITETGQQMGAGAGIKDILGTGAELGSYLVGGGGGAGVARATLGGAVKQGVKTGALSGLIGGGLQAGGAEAQRPESTIGSIAGKTAIGAGLGGATGGLLGGALPAVGAGVRKVSGALTPEGRISSIVSKNRKAIENLESGNSVVRKAFAGAENQGHDIKGILSSEDWLVGSVDNNGKIRTTKPGGALDKLESTIKPAESVVMDNIRREGKSIARQDVERAMLQNIEDSGIAGAAKTNAQRQVQSEIAGMKINPDGSIPIEELQKLKMYKGTVTNYIDQNIQKADKAITNALKTIIEDNVQDVNVKALNAELAKFYALRGVLRKLDGKVIKGGRLGKYFSQVVGAAAGSQFGGPVGAVVGAELGGRIQGGLLQSTLKKGTGKLSGLSEDILQAVETGKSPLPKPTIIPESRRLMAPAIKPPQPDTSRLFSQEEARKVLESTLNPKMVQSNIRGIEKTIKKSAAPTANKASTISKTIPQGIPKKSTAVKKAPAKKVATKKTVKKSTSEKSLLSEAKKYETAEEFVKEYVDSRKMFQILPQESLKIPTKVYRGVSKTGGGMSELGKGSAVEGYGLYTTTKKKIAEGYAKDSGIGGKVLELGKDSLPSNPIYFRDSNSVRDWITLSSKKLGIRPQEFENAIGINELVNALGFDGVAFEMGGGITFVKYPKSKSKLLDIYKKAHGK